MNVLAIETSNPWCSIAIQNTNGEISSINAIKENSHGVLIFKYIDECLRDAEISKEDLNLILISNGPGSFTGLRVGCSVAQGLALGLGIEIIPYSSLKVIAQSYFSPKFAYSDTQEAIDSEIKIIQDAHMNDLYIGHYVKNDLGIAEEVCGDFVLKKDQLSSFLKKDYKGSYTGDKGYLGEKKTWFKKLFRKTDSYFYFPPTATYLLEIAKYDLQNKDLRKKPEEVFPVYLSGSDQWVKKE